MKKLLIIVGISAVIYLGVLSGCQSISNRKQANKINNSLNQDLDDFLKYIEQH